AIARGSRTNRNAGQKTPPTPSFISTTLGVKQELPPNLILDDNYVGNIARHFVYTRNLNQLPAGTRLNPPNSTINVNALRPYPGFGNILLRDESDNSNYNSLQVSASRRLRNGLSFGSSYTFSKTMDTIGGGTPLDSYHPKNDVALSGIHRRPLLNFNYIYTLPFFVKSSSAFTRHVLGGWEVSGVTSFQSGAPNTVNAPVDIARIGAGSARATVLGNPALSGGARTPARWFKTEAFLNPALTTP